MSDDQLQTLEPLAVRQEEAARLIGVTPRTLRTWTADASMKIPHRRISANCVLYPVKELRDWVNQRNG